MSLFWQRKKEKEEEEEEVKKRREEKRKEEEEDEEVDEERAVSIKREPAWFVLQGALQGAFKFGNHDVTAVLPLY